MQLSTVVILLFSVNRTLQGYVGCHIVDDDDYSENVQPTSDLIDNFPERNVYQTTSLIRNKRDTIDKYENTQLKALPFNLKCIDPILAELKSVKLPTRCLNNPIDPPINPSTITSDCISEINDPFVETNAQSL